jgi:hypothetical protein
MDAVNPLNYAPRPRAAQRFWRWAYRLIFFAAIVIAAIEWGPGLWSHAQSIYWEQKCLNFMQPPDHVVFEMNRGNILHSELCVPAIRFMGTRVIAARVPDSTIFLHEMGRPDGTRCILLLGLFPGPNALEQFGLQYMEWTVSLSPRYSNWNFVMAQTTMGSAFSHWKFFAGQPDVNNPSHFSFDYEMDGTRHTYDAWLKNDGQLIVSQRP